MNFNGDGKAVSHTLQRSTYHTYMYACRNMLIIRDPPPPPPPLTGHRGGGGGRPGRFFAGSVASLFINKAGQLYLGLGWYIAYQREARTRPSCAKSSSLHTYEYYISLSPFFRSRLLISPLLVRFSLEWDGVMCDKRIYLQTGSRRVHIISIVYCSQPAKPAYYCTSILTTPGRYDSPTNKN